MSSLQQPSRFIPFTNSAQRTQLLPTQGGFPQSLSGSETDVSTSNENLSHEERYVIRHTARQEPQGQENLSSNRSSLDVSSSSYNTLIIHGAGDEPWTGRLSGIRDLQDTGTSSYLSSHPYSGSPTTSNGMDSNKTTGQGQKMGSHSPSPSLGGNKEMSPKSGYDCNSPSRLFDPSVREITDIPDDYLSQSQVLKHLAKEVKVVPSCNSCPGGRESSVPLLDDNSSNNVLAENSALVDQLKRLSLPRMALGSNKEVARLGTHDHEPLLPLDYDLSNLPPPPEYPKWIESPTPLSAVQRLKAHSNTMADKLSLSRSQPDLSRLGTGKITSDVSGCRNIITSPRPKTNGREDLESQGREIWPPAEMVEILIQENSSLKLELETCYQKVAKSHKLEQEIGKIHRAHEELVQSSERRERLERAARARLQADCRRLQEINRSLREQADMLSTQLLTVRPQAELSDTSENLRKELSKREVLIAQLITQNKELVAAKERQEIELAAQRATLQEQRTHIDILDTALTNAQGNVVRLEEECRKKQVYVERVAQLQRALSSLQLASDRREQTERKLRLQLERELRNERARAGGGFDEGDSGGGSSGVHGSQDGCQQGETAPELKRRLREREEKIMRLEGEVAKWEQRYLEENTLRQAAIDAASIPKDAKIAALEKTSQETEKLIAEARSEKIRHMDEVHAAQKKVADLESRLKDLESKLAERDAMIRVLQKHTYDKDVSSYPSMLGRSPHHTPHPSLHGNSDLGTVLGTSVSREELDPVSTTSVFSTVSSVLTSSCSTGISSYTGSCSDSTTSKLSSYHHHPSSTLGSSFAGRSKYGTVANKSFDDTKKSLDDQLKELDSQLDSQLLSKRGLCCFPGFSNTSTASRKGKISKPLLASVGGTSPHHHLFEPGFLQGLVPNRYEQGRPEEIMLLEKQGRSSQQQRMQETCLTGSGATGARNRSGSLPPTSLPRPRRPHKPPGGGKERKLGEYGRLSDGEGRKTPATSCEGPDTSESKDHQSPARSNIPSPRKLGEYGRLGEGEGRSLRKPGSTVRVGSSQDNSTAGTKGRDSTASASEDSGSTIPSQSKLRLFHSPRARRGSSVTRDTKPASTDSSSTSGKSVASAGKYRIQF